MYKEIFKLVVAIISQPGKAWEILTKKEEKDDEFLSRFVYPLIGFVTVAAFWACCSPGKSLISNWR